MYVFNGSGMVSDKLKVFFICMHNGMNYVYKLINGNERQNAMSLDKIISTP